MNARQVGAIVASAGLLLSGCAGSETDPTPAGSESVATSSPDAEPTSAEEDAAEDTASPDTTDTAEPTEPALAESTAAEPITFRDTLDLVTEGDPGADELFAALDASQGDVLQLDLVLQRPFEPGMLDYRSNPDETRVNVVASAPETDIFSMVVAADVVDMATDVEWFRVSGQFSVEPREDEHGVSTVFVLTELERTIPSAETDEELCAADDTELRIVEDARRLVAEPQEYEALRAAWIDSPRLWWAVKSTAENLVVSEGTASGDGVTVACEEFWGW